MIGRRKQACLIFYYVSVGAVAIGYCWEGEVPAEPSLRTHEQLPGPEARQELSLSTGPIALKSVTLGPRSCSSSGCHGNIRADRGGVNHNGDRLRDANLAGIRRDEFFVWLEQDPHSSSASTLLGEHSKRILLHLGALDKTDDGFEPTDNYDRHMTACAGCHAPHATKEKLSFTALRQSALDLGVTCESCHGSAGDWINEHYSSAWTKIDRHQKTNRHGMRDTENLVSRAQVCAHCHVGNSNDHVGHDLIAAGHPPLKFEFTAYLDLLPKHWNEHRERAQTPDFELRSWLAGQLASTYGALQVLESRTRPALPGEAHPPTWPELAEFDCFACHHDLESPSWRIERGFTGRKPGQVSWGSWYWSMPRRVLVDEESAEAVAKLGDLLRNGIGANQQKIHDQVVQVFVDDELSFGDSYLKQWLEQDTPQPMLAEHKQDLLRRILGAYQGDDGAAAVENWDVAVQLYLLLVALDRDAQSAQTPALREIRAGLSFQSPEANSDAVKFESPRRFAFTRRELQVKLSEVLRQHLEPEPIDSTP
jgi:hypothetical protein